jgi:membrane protein DedA with SNARE-associated domain
VVLFLGAGYWFGNVPVVKEHFSLVILGIIVVSVLPMLFELIRARQPEQECTAVTSGVAPTSDDSAID